MQRRFKHGPRSLIFSALLVAWDGHAQQAPASVPLTSYQAVPSCPGAAAFKARVLARLAGRPPSSQHVRLGVEIVQDNDQSAPGAFTGRLHTTDDGAMASTREVQGVACSDVVEALSLLAAFSLEAGEDFEDPSIVPRPAELAATPSAHWKIGPLALALAQSAGAPEGALGAGVGVALQPPAQGALIPWFMLSVYRTLASSAALPDSAAAARFNMTAAYAVGCPVRWPLTGWWSLRPCVDFDLGRITGRGLGSDRIETRRGLWASVGAAARGEIHVWGPLWLAALVGGVLPLARHEFYFAPDTVIFHVPATGWRGAGFVSLLF
jgi:hypothetical protein